MQNNKKQVVIPEGYKVTFKDMARSYLISALKQSVETNDNNIWAFMKVVSHPIYNIKTLDGNGKPAGCDVYELNTVFTVNKADMDNYFFKNVDEVEKIIRDPQAYLKADQERKEKLIQEANNSLKTENLDETNEQIKKDIESGNHPTETIVLEKEDGAE